MKHLWATTVLFVLMAMTQVSRPATVASLNTVMWRSPVRTILTRWSSRLDLVAAPSKTKPKVRLMRTASWFVYPHGCDTVAKRRDVIIHFHGAHTTVIPRYLKSGVDAVLVIINKGIGSGAYSDALPTGTQVDHLLERIETTIAEECNLKNASITRLALSSWSAGYGAVEQFLRLRPEKVDAVLLADGLHVGFTNPHTRVVNAARLDVFIDFARQATRGEKLMAITHSAIKPEDYAGAGETAQALSDAAHVPIWPVAGLSNGMERVTLGRRGEFYVEGYGGNNKAAHAKHLYAIGKTSFARIREYWKEG